MQPEHELLIDIGMTKSEIAAYFALLDLGATTTGPLIKKANIAAGKAYLVLDKLIKKGLVTYVIKSGTKYYQAKDPELLLSYLKEKEHELKHKEEQLQKLIPTLKAQYQENKYKPVAEIYEDVKGFKTFYDWTLKELNKGDTILVMGVPKIANERFKAYLLNWNKERIKKGISMRIIYNNDSRSIGISREKMNLTEVRYMKKELETPVWVDIFNDYVVTINAHDDPVCFLIKNKATAQSYRTYFELIWKQSER